jgi:hypothetical protein
VVGPPEEAFTADRIHEGEPPRQDAIALTDEERVADLRGPRLHDPPLHLQPRFVVLAARRSPLPQLSREAPGQREGLSLVHFLVLPPGSAHSGPTRTTIRFQRSIPLPNGVKVDDVKATYENGILEVVIPKAGELTGAKRIPVAVGSGATAIAAEGRKK